MPYLLKDIVGTASRMTFGKKGDKIKIFADHENVYIAENPSGVRFSVLKKDVSDKKVEPDLEIVKKKK